MTTTLRIVGKVNSLPEGYEVVGDVSNRVVDFGNFREVMMKDSKLIAKKRRCVSFGKTKEILETTAECHSCNIDLKVCKVVSCPKDKVIPVLILEEL